MTFGVKMIWKNLYFTIFERFLWGVDKCTPSLFGLRLFSEPIIFWFTGAVEKLKAKRKTSFPNWKKCHSSLVLLWMFSIYYISEMSSERFWSIRFCLTLLALFRGRSQRHTFSVAFKSTWGMSSLGTWSTSMWTATSKCGQSNHPNRFCQRSCRGWSLLLSKWLFWGMTPRKDWCFG